MAKFNLIFIFGFLWINANSQLNHIYNDSLSWHLSSKLMLYYSNQNYLASEQLAINLLDHGNDFSSRSLSMASDVFDVRANYEYLERVKTIADSLNLKNILSKSALKRLTLEEQPEESIETMDFQYSQKLISLFLQDQDCRSSNHSKAQLKKLGYETTTDVTICKGNIDSTLSERLKLLIDKYGMPDKNIVGNWGIKAIGTIAAHSPDLELKVQIRDSKILDLASQAILTDKISSKKYGYSKFGTQVNMDGFQQVTNASSLDSIRMKMGLFTMSDYCKLMNIPNCTIQDTTGHKYDYNSYNNLEKHTPFSTKSVMGKSIEVLKHPEKPTLLFFWFIRCSRCKSALPFLNEIHDKYQNDINIIGLNMLDETDEQVIEYSEKHSIQFPMVSQGKRIAEEVYGAFFGPTLILISKKGYMVYNVSGYEKEKLNRYLMSYK